MKKVKLKPDCHERHYYPHIPWYVKSDTSGICEGLESLIWVVRDHQSSKDVYWVDGFMADDNFIQMKQNHYYMQIKDCEPIII